MENNFKWPNTFSMAKGWNVVSISATKEVERGNNLVLCSTKGQK